MIKKNNNFIYLTLCNDKYVKGVIALNKSLKNVNSKYNLLILYFNLCDDNINLLKNYDILLKKVEPISSKKQSKKFINTYTKLLIFSMIDYDKIIFMDADTIVLKNIDHLFDIEHNFSVAPDLGNQLMYNRFNTGVMIIKPNIDVFNDMMIKKDILPSYDGSDQ